MKVLLLLVQGTVTRTIELQESIGKERGKVVDTLCILINMPSTPCALTPAAGGGPDSPLTSCSAQENWPYALPGQHSRVDPLDRVHKTVCLDPCRIPLWVHKAVCLDPCRIPLWVHKTVCLDPCRIPLWVHKTVCLDPCCIPLWVLKAVCLDPCCIPLWVLKAVCLDLCRIPLWVHKAVCLDLPASPLPNFLRQTCLDPCHL
ncbi:hypothetical protein STEG23_031252 [Scotinomys teguina]